MSGKGIDYVAGETGTWLCVGITGAERNGSLYCIYATPFLDTRPLDARAKTVFSLTEDSMMECAAQALKQEVSTVLANYPVFPQKKRILILVGAGNNGGDGYALARLLASDADLVTVCVVAEPRSEMCKMQKERCAKSKIISFISMQTFLTSMQNVREHTESNCQQYPFDAIVDCVFGSGFHGPLSSEIENILIEANKLTAVKIACDVPSGLDQLGNASGVVFRADVTVTMGAQKICLYSDKAKEYTGIVKVADLGASRRQFEMTSCEEEMPVAELLEKSDMVLPHRYIQNVNKGSFGHVAVVAGEKIGAAVIAGSSAFRFGAGLVTLVGKKNDVFPGKEIVLDDDGQLPQMLRKGAGLAKCSLQAGQKIIVPYDLLYSENFPVNTTAIALGMGLGREERDVEYFDNGMKKNYFEYLNEHADIPCVLDADIFYNDALYTFLKGHTGSIVLTPHPKEFVSLLQKCNLGTYTVPQAIEHKIELIKKFCNAFPRIVLLLKGSVVVIGVKYAEEKNVRLYMNPYGTNALAKGGSGDVLAGMIAALLSSQTPLAATISASLAHAIASSHAPCDYALTPFSLMKLVSEL